MKLLPIENCVECKHSSLTIMDHWICLLEGKRIIDDPWGIQDWCPLEDEKE